MRHGRKKGITPGITVPQKSSVAEFFAKDTTSSIAVHRVAKFTPGAELKNRWTRASSRNRKIAKAAGGRPCRFFLPERANGVK